MSDRNYPKPSDANFDHIADLIRRLKSAKDTLLEPTEELPEDEYRQLPNQYQSGQGLGKVLKAWSALQPEGVRIKSDKFGDITMDPMGISAPMAVAGTLGKELAEAGNIAREYKVPGKWQQDRYNLKGQVEELPIDFLSKHKGNELGKTNIEALKKSIREEGLNEPLVLSFDPDTNKIKLGEGNHRLQALRELGYTHAPVRATRSSVYDPADLRKSIPFKPSTDRIDPGYYPAESKPSDIIDFDALEKQAALDAYKSEFNLPLAHGTNPKNIAIANQKAAGLISDTRFLNRPTGEVVFKDGSYAWFDPKTGTFSQVDPSEIPLFSEFKPSSTGTYGEGIYTSPLIRDKTGQPYSHYYSEGTGGMSIPLRARGSKIYNYGRIHTTYPELKDIIPSHEESISKLSELTGLPRIELWKMQMKDRHNFTELLKKFPEHFEGVAGDKEINIFKPKNLRGEFAEYNPAMKDSADYMAGLAAAGLSFEQIKQLLDKKSTDKDEI